MEDKEKLQKELIEAYAKWDAAYAKRNEEDCSPRDRDRANAEQDEANIEIKRIKAALAGKEVDDGWQESSSL